jgi:hypothetical protein
MIFFEIDFLGSIDMRLKIQKWGNSAAIRLPRTLLSKIDATIGDVVEIDADDLPPKGVPFLS